MPSLTAQLSAAHAVLAAIAYLMAKHAVADFILQTSRQRAEKGHYGALGGLQHSLTHIVLTTPVFVLVPPLALALMAGLLAAEFAVHYHIDWTKEQIVRRYRWTSQTREFWWTIGLDQLLHGLTYVALLWIAFSV